MPINAEIPLQGRPLQLDNQLDNYSKMMAIKQLMLQNRAGEESFSEQQKLREIYAQSGGDANKLRSLLYQGGFGQQAMAADKSQLDAQKTGADIQHTRGQISKDQITMGSQLAGGFLALPEDQKAARYPEFVATWKANNLPNSDKIENEAWRPELSKGLQMIAAWGQSPEQQATRADFAATGGPTAASGTLVQPGAPQEQQAMPVQPQDVPGPVSLPANAAGMSAGQENAAYDAARTLPTQEVTAKAPLESPDSLRAEAIRLEKLAPRTKANLDLAKVKRDEAVALEGKILQEQGLEQQKQNAAENIRVREEGIKVRQQNQGNQAKTNTAKLSDDFRQEQAVKEYRTVQPLIASMENASKANTAGSDLDMIYAIAKIFDPGSVVREGEMVMVKNAGGLPAQVQSALGFVMGGQRLSTTLRQEILDQAHSRADNYKQAYDSVTKSYRDQAQRWELNPDDIVRDYKVTARGAGRRTTDGQTPGWNDADQKRLDELERKRGAK